MATGKDYENDLDEHEKDAAAAKAVNYRGDVRQKAEENVEAAGGVKGNKYVTGPKGGARTAGAVHKGPPKTSGPKTVGGLIGYVTGKRFGGGSKPAATEAPKKPETDVDRGLEEITSRRYGTNPSAAKPKRGKDDIP